MKSIIHSFPRYIFMLHFDLEKTKSTCCNLVAIFPAAFFKILRYIQNAFNFRVQPLRTMTITTNELLWHYQDCFTV